MILILYILLLFIMNGYEFNNIVEIFLFILILI